MFDSLKKIFGRAVQMPSTPVLLPQDGYKVSEWAQTQGLTCTSTVKSSGKARKDGTLFVLDGVAQDKPWRLECGASTRDFIVGQELRGRSDLGVLESVSVVLMNNALKMDLEKRAYSIYTDSLQTAIDPKLPEEMRWLAIYPEVTLTDVPPKFSDRYAVLASRREHAAAWITSELAQALMDWPPSGPSPEVPFLMMLLRGKCYLRMEYQQADLPTLQHVALVYKLACEAALTRVAQNMDIDYGNG